MDAEGSYSMVTLMSNVDTGTKYSGENTRSNFTTHIDAHLELGERDEVRLAEIFIPNFIHNITRDTGRFKITFPKRGVPVRTAINIMRWRFQLDSYYGDRNQLLRMRRPAAPTPPQPTPETNPGMIPMPLTDPTWSPDADRRRAREMLLTELGDHMKREGIAIPEDRNGPRNARRGRKRTRTTTPIRLVPYADELDGEEEEEEGMSVEEVGMDPEDEGNVCGERGGGTRSGASGSRTPPTSSRFDLSAGTFRGEPLDLDDDTSPLDYAEVEIPSGDYTPQEFVRAFNSRVQVAAKNTFKGWLTYDKRGKNFTFHLGPGESISIWSPKMRYMLGFDALGQMAMVENLVNMSMKKFTPRFPAAFMHNLNQAIVFTNLTKQSILGNTQSSYLRTVDISGRHRDGEVISHRYNDSQWHAARTNKALDHITVQLRDVVGNLLTIEQGVTTVVLAIRRRSTTGPV